MTWRFVIICPVIVTVPYTYILVTTPRVYSSSSDVPLWSIYSSSDSFWFKSSSDAFFISEILSFATAIIIPSCFGLDCLRRWSWWRDRDSLCFSLSTFRGCFLWRGIFQAFQTRIVWSHEHETYWQREKYISDLIF